MSCAADLEDIEFTAEQLQMLTNVDMASDVSLEALALEVGTVKLLKGRLEVDEDGSTIVVHGGHDYDADTDTVSVSSKGGSMAAPDGLLVNADGEVCVLTVLRC
jgi:hypothetical protein